MIKLITYPNGLRVVVDPNPNIRTVCAGIWVGVGSASENKQTNGISHFVEHMLFKGTDKLNAFQIADKFESVGAMVNAFTGKENTCYYFKCMDEYVEHCFELLADIFFDGAFREDDLDKERKVIIEEINMVEDSPEDLAFDLIAKVNFDNHPLGQTILGPIQNIKKFGKQDIQKFMGEFYIDSNVVLSFAGNITEKQVDDIVKKCFLDRLIHRTFERKVCAFDTKASNYSQLIKDFEQSNVIVSFPSIKFNDDLSATQSLLNAILGGGMSSRLFQRIREQAGLAYSIFTSPSYYLDCGVFNIVCNITPTNTQKVLDALRSELVDFLKNGTNNEEFERAKAQLKSAFVFGQESVQSCMITAGKLMLSANEIVDYDTKIKQINAVTKQKLDDLAHNILDFSKAKCAYVGKAVDAQFDLSPKTSVNT